MNTTELIKLLKSVEKGASGRSREVSFDVMGYSFMPEPTIKISSTGDGCAGAQLCLDLKEQEK